MFRALTNSLLSLVYPQECRVCGAQTDSHDGGPACENCWASTRIFDHTEMLCDKCGAFFAAETAIVPVFCHKCDDHFYDKAIAVGVYERALAACVIDLKTSPHLPKRAVSAIENAARTAHLSNIHLIIPVPLSKLRMAERRFNQADVIAGIVGRTLWIPVDSLSLSRKVHTPVHRAGMDQKARELTVKNAFEILRPKLIAGRNILLIDDVFTSGSTSSNCAKILKKYGSGRVDVFTLARAVMD
jgi:ComF family protein